MKIYIITNPQLGWDCIVGCFSTYELAVNYCKESYIDDVGIGNFNYESFDPKTDLGCFIHEKELIK